MDLRRARIHLAVLLLAGVSCNIGGDKKGSLPPELQSSCDPCKFAGNEGICFVPEFDAAKRALNDPNIGHVIAESEHPDCKAAEVCVLCTDPRTGEDTGACDLGSLACPEDKRFEPASCDNVKSFTGADKLVACGANSVCLSYAFIDDEELVERIDPCEHDPSTACVPRVVVETAGFFTFTSCTGNAGAEGRCMSVEFPEVKIGADRLPQDVCADDERCMTCYDPFDGEPTGVCDMGCDPGPAVPVVLYPECQNGRGRCVHEDRLSESARDVFQRRQCENNYLCVSTQALNDGPYAGCVGDNPQDDNYFGSCGDLDVYSIDNAGRLEDRGYCQSLFGDGFGCVPCWRGGQPTNFPGCPEEPPEWPPADPIL